MTYQLATERQLAAMLVEGEQSIPGPKFIITAHGDDHRLAVAWQDDWRELCSTRDVSRPRAFANISAAIRAAQRIAAIAGREPDHDWTGETHRLPPMPEINVQIRQTPNHATKKQHA